MLENFFTSNEERMTQLRDQNSGVRLRKGKAIDICVDLGLDLAKKSDILDLTKVKQKLH